ncbi:MAG: cytochrome b/b6 domain-containing protein [Gammaproteobacteria bacterium]|nr:cytochrome b/b6 domain-containing protein [Gammaproteobacteria bacterium]
MPLRNTTRRWGTVSRLLHWLVAALVIAQFVLANLAGGLPPGVAKLAMLARHKSVGITILVLALLRLLWRASQPVPTLPPSMPRWQARLATGTHHLLYALLFAMPLSGWLMSSARNYPVSWFGLVQLPDLVGASERLYAALHATHATLAVLLALTALLHVAGALKHHFIDHDDVLRRMLPFVRGLALLAVILCGALVVDATMAAPSPATPATAAPALVRYALDPAHSTLEFRFQQAGATTTGRFARFDVVLDWPAGAPPGRASLDVQVHVASLDTGDRDRDGTLRGNDLFAVELFPRARFISSRITPAAATASAPAAADGAGATASTGRYLANGRLQIRDQSHTLALPLVLRLGTEAGRRVAWLRGETTLRRLDYGVGQGEWQSTEWVGNDVVVRWDLRLEEK